MKKWTGSIAAELLKMKHTYLYPLHVGLPVLGSAVFLLYYSAAGQNPLAQLAGYLELLGAVLPFVISLICAENIGLEESNRFQTMGGVIPQRQQSLWIKWLVLAGLGALAIGGAVALFGLGFSFVLGKKSVTAAGYWQLALLLGAGSLPVYLEHLFWNLRFSKSLSQCIGVAEFLLSALFLTGLGEGRWQFFPCSWSARSVYLYCSSLAVEGGTRLFSREMKAALPVCLLLSAGMCVIIGVWWNRADAGQLCAGE